MSTQNVISRKTILDIKKMKENGEKIAMLTAYDFGMASLIDEADIDIILVGDSLGNVVLGYENTLPVTMADMLHHTKAVVRGAQKALIVADMPFMSYQISPQDALANAGKFLQEAGAQAVKLEGGKEQSEAVYKITSSGIPVMAHLGLTPQSIHQMGGYKVQGKKEDAAQKIMSDASISIPTIGIGAGVHCDGQVLVINDMLGMYERLTPKFVKKYANLSADIKNAVKTYIAEVKKLSFPDDEHSFK